MHCYRTLLRIRENYKARLGPIKVKEKDPEVDHRVINLPYRTIKVRANPVGAVRQFSDAKVKKRSPRLPTNISPVPTNRSEPSC